MIDIAVLPGFIAVILLFLLPPGPDMAYMIAVGLEGGRAAALQAIAGIVCGMSIYAAAAVAGMGQLAEAHPRVFDAVKLAGAGYLLWLAASTIRTARAPFATDGAGSSERWFLRGFVVSISNPKIILFFVAVLPQFAGHARNAVAQSTLLAAIDIGLELVLYGGIGVCAAAFQQRFMQSVRAQIALKYVASVVYVALAAVVGGEVLIG